MEFNLSNLIAMYGALLSTFLLYLNYFHYKKHLWYIDMLYKDNAGKDFDKMAITLYNRMNKSITIKNIDLEIKKGKKYEIYEAIIEDKKGVEFNLEKGKIRLLPTVTLEPNGFERIIINYSNKLSYRKARLWENSTYYLVVNTVSGKTFRLKNNSGY